MACCRRWSLHFVLLFLLELKDTSTKEPCVVTPRLQQKTQYSVFACILLHMRVYVCVCVCSSVCTYLCSGTYVYIYILYMHVHIRLRAFCTLTMDDCGNEKHQNEQVTSSDTWTTLKWHVHACACQWTGETCESRFCLHSQTHCLDPGLSNIGKYKAANKADLRLPNGMSTWLEINSRISAGF